MNQHRSDDELDYGQQKGNSEEDGQGDPVKRAAMRSRGGGTRHVLLVSKGRKSRLAGRPQGRDDVAS